MKALSKTLTLAALMVAFAAATLGSSSAQACSYYIKEVQKKNQLIAEAASNLNLELSQVQAVEIADFRWWESKPTPMCPAEMTYVGQVTLKYQDPTATFPRECITQVSVTKVEDWKTQMVDYSFENTQTDCK